MPGRLHSRFEDEPAGVRASLANVLSRDVCPMPHSAPARARVEATVYDPPGARLLSLVVRFSPTGCRRNGPGAVSL